MLTARSAGSEQETGALSQHHRAVAGEAYQRCLMRAHDPFQRVVIFAQHAHDGFGLGARREGGEAAQIAEHHDDLDAPAIENAVVTRAVDQFGHLRREKALEPVDAFRALL